MNVDLYIQVKRYYRREMNLEERANWEAKLASDATFSTEIIPYVKMYESIQLKGDQLLYVPTIPTLLFYLQFDPKNQWKPQRPPILFASTLVQITYKVSLSDLTL